MSSTDPYQQAMSSLLGQTLKCTLSDGRTATGTLICIDRLKNLILSQVVEERIVDSSMYSGSTGGKMITTKRILAQAMIPGMHLVKVEVARSVYQQCVMPALQTAPEAMSLLQLRNHARVS